MTQTMTNTNDAIIRTGVFTKEGAEALSASFNDPDWLAEKRSMAWSVFEETPLPSLSDEAWRRTSLRKVKWNKFTLDSTSPLSKVEKLSDLPEDIRAMFDEDRPAAGRMLFVNGEVIYHEIDKAVADQGVIYTDLQSAAKTHTDLVQPHLMTNCVPPSDSKFAALNAAFWQNGTFIHVPKEVEVDNPFHTIVLLDGEGTACIHRSLIVAEIYGNVDFIEETASMNDDSLGLNVGVVEIIAEEGAQVRYVDVQQLNSNVYNFNTKRSIGGSDSNVVWDLGEFGSALTKTFIDSQLVGDGANMECNGVYFLNGNQHIDIDSLMQHIGYATSGDLLIHGALKDHARSVFIGMIKIDPTGQLTNSYLKNQNLILDKTARADSIPSLEIEANDVRASHAATISKVEEEYVFYLQSRGIPHEDAIQMIVEGFFSTIFDRMGNERVKEKLMRTVTRKMTGEEQPIEELMGLFEEV